MVKMLHMFLLTPTIDQYVIKIDHDEPTNKGFKDCDS